MSTINFEVISNECLEGKHTKCNKAEDCACACHDPENVEDDEEAAEPEDDDY